MKERTDFAALEEVCEEGSVVAAVLQFLQLLYEL